MVVEVTSLLGAGNFACENCPVRFKTDEKGSTYRTDCICEANYAPVFDASGNVKRCDDCSPRAVCPGGKTLPYPKAGSYLVDDVIVTCIPEGACVEGGTCAPGFTGERCSECVKGYYRVQWKYVICSVVRMFGCSVVRMFSCSDVSL